MEQGVTPASPAILLRMFTALAVVLALLPQSSPAFRAWNEPIEPFRVAGPLYYVGPKDITSLLVTTPAGHALIDGGLEESAPIIIENVRKLGFRIEDVKILLSTHAHADHAGGLARLKAASGARLYAGAADVDLLRRGGRGDFAFGDTLPFPAVEAGVAVRDGQEVALAGVRFRAIATPGHTKGCTSWTFTVEDGGVSRRVLMIGGLTAPGYRLVNNAGYPRIVEDFEGTFRTLRSLPADIVFEGHGFAFDLEARRQGKRPFVDPGALKQSVDKAEAAFRKALQEQK
ncbi:MAG: Beta-lactamase [Acidobacteria bacterium]|nr:Beta-lactamase [Acidobacteriota bacterium]